MDEQAALFEFSERLQHVSSVQQVHDVGLDAIVRALGCERAAILLFDSSATMRFAAWRGLSGANRQGPEGTFPLAREATESKAKLFLGDRTCVPSLQVESN